MRKLFLLIIIFVFAKGAFAQGPQTYWTPGVPPGSTSFSPTFRGKAGASDSLMNFYLANGSKWFSILTARQVYDYVAAHGGSGDTTKFLRRNRADTAYGTHSFLNKVRIGIGTDPVFLPSLGSQGTVYNSQNGRTSFGVFNPNAGSSATVGMFVVGDTTVDSFGDHNRYGEWSLYGPHNTSFLDAVNIMKIASGGSVDKFLIYADNGTIQLSVQAPKPGTPNPSKYYCDLCIPPADIAYATRSPGIGMGTPIVNKHSMGKALTIQTDATGGIGLEFVNKGISTSGQVLASIIAQADTTSAFTTGQIDFLTDGTDKKTGKTIISNYNAGTKTTALTLLKNGTIAPGSIPSGTAGADSVLVSTGGVIKKISPTYYGTGGGSGSYWPLSGSASFTNGVQIETNLHNFTIGDLAHSRVLFGVNHSSDTTTNSISLNANTYWNPQINLKSRGIDIGIFGHSNGAYHGFRVNIDTADNVTGITRFYNGINRFPIFYDSKIDTGKMSANPLTIPSVQWVKSYVTNHGGAGNTIYTGDGIITADRTVGLNSHSLTFGDFSSDYLNVNANVHQGAMFFTDGTDQSYFTINANNGVGLAYNPGIATGTGYADFNANASGATMTVNNPSGLKTQRFSINQNGIFLTDTISNRFPRVTHHYPYHSGSLELLDTKTVDSLIAAGGGGNTIYTGDGTTTGNRAVTIGTGYSLGFLAGANSIIINSSGTSLAYNNNQFYVNTGGVMLDVADASTGLKHNRITLTPSGGFLTDTINNRAFRYTHHYPYHSGTREIFDGIIIDSLLATKQATLVSGTNIKTVNSTTLLGSGNLAITTANTDTTATGFLPKSNLYPLGDARYAKIGSGITDPTTTSQDIIVRGTSTLGRLGKGADSTFLWVDPSTHLLAYHAGKIYFSGGSFGNMGSSNTDTLFVKNSAVMTKLLTGYSASAGTVAATDNILQAFNKMNGNIAGKQATLTFDGTPTSGSGNPVTSGGLFTALALKATTASPTLTGTPAAPTPGSNINTTQIPTTAWTNTYYAAKASPTFTGTVTLPITSFGLASKIGIVEGTGGRTGQTALVAGTKAITITGLTTSSRAFVTFVSVGGTVSTTWQYAGVCTANTLTITALTNANTTDTTDTSTLNYVIFN